MKGYCYALLNKHNGLVKIGKSINPEERLRVLLSQGGITQYMFFTSNKITSPLRLESIAHFHFRESRVIGEWFSASYDSIVDFIKSNENLENCEKSANKNFSKMPDFLYLLYSSFIGRIFIDFNKALIISDYFSKWLSEQDNYGAIIGDDLDFIKSEKLCGHSLFSWTLALYLSQNYDGAFCLLRDFYENTSNTDFCPSESASLMYDDILKPFMKNLIEKDKKENPLAWDRQNSPQKA